MSGMIDISSKVPVLRIARASGRIVLSEKSLSAIRKHSVRKGDVLETARVAAIAAVKKTPELIPHCHQIPIENVQVRFSAEKDSITAEIEVAATAKTGVEMEAITGVLTALAVIWDMVKYLEKDDKGQYPQTKIENIKVLLKEKKEMPKEAAGEKPTHKKHKEKAPLSARISIVTVSNSRSIDTDESGQLIADLAKKANHSIALHIVVKDKIEQIKSAVEDFLKSDSDALILNGGTGISPDDVTVDAVRGFLDREIPNFNSLFVNLSFAEIGSACVTSRACAGIASGKPVFSIPGSPAACRLAMEKIIIPEIGHILHHATKR
ncbi:MAG: cyclic pyranopterin monophosphate synthase MoaC [Planctomycetota bacterium]